MRGKAQLGVAPLDAVPQARQSVVLTTEGQVLAVPSGHRLAGRSLLELKDLAGERLVVPPPGRPHRRMLGALPQSEEVERGAAMEADGWALMLSFVAVGIGAAVVNACCRMPEGVVAYRCRNFQACTTGASTCTAWPGPPAPADCCPR